MGEVVARFLRETTQDGSMRLKEVVVVGVEVGLEWLGDEEPPE